jgi:alpha-L-fucosidase
MKQNGLMGLLLFLLLAGCQEPQPDAVCATFAAMAADSADKDQDLLKAKPEVVEAWKDMRFGMFICWGPASLTGKEVGFARNGPRQPWPWRGRHRRGTVPAEVYDNLYKKFDAPKFDAQEWISLVKASGAKYIIFLTNHLAGFSMWNSKLDDPDIMDSPLGRDVTGEIIKACQKADIKVILYYCQCDWTHPDYATKNHDRYLKYFHGQVRELCSNYGKIDGFWFDVDRSPATAWKSKSLFKMIRRLQPDIIINNRCGLRGDYYCPEQHIGKFQLRRPWETCMTLGTQWAWKPNDRLKSLKQCIDVLVRCAARDGNLALNTNPMPDGRIEPRQATRFREIGQWLKKHGESIYGTRGGPFATTWGGTTRKGDTIYVHVLKWTDRPLTLPPIKRKIVSHSMLTGGTASVKQTDKAVTMDVPPAHRNDLDTIIKLELDGSAMDIGLIPPTPLLLRGAISIGKRVTASGEWSTSYRAAKAFDGDVSTRWGGAPDTRSGWLAVDLGKEEIFDRVFISEGWDRVRRFELQMKKGDSWQTFFKGTTIGENFSATFPPVTVRHVRLNMPEAINVPTIWEFHLFAPKKRK